MSENSFICCQKGINYIPRPDLDNKIKNGNSEIEMKWIEIVEEKNRNKIIGVIYRHPHKKDIDFIPKLTDILNKIKKEKKHRVSYFQVILTMTY